MDVSTPSGTAARLDSAGVTGLARGGPPEPHQATADPPTTGGLGAAIGLTYRLRLCPIDVLVHDDPEVPQSVMRNRTGMIRRASVLRSVMREMGLDGVFSVEGGACQSQRRPIMGALNVSHLRGIYPTLATTAERLHRRWVDAA